MLIPRSSNKQGHMLTSLYKSFAHQCVKNCVQSSIDLIQVVYQTHRNVATEWWWDSLCKYSKQTPKNKTLA